MSPNQMIDLAIVLRTTIALALLIAAVQFMIKKTFVDEFRQDVFRLRRQATMLVVNGELDGDDEAFRLICLLSNFLLQNADNITFGRMFLHSFAFNDETKEPIGKAFATIANPKTRRAMKEIHRELGDAIIRHLFKASTGGILLSLVVKTLHVLKRGTGLMGDAVYRVERAAIALSKDENAFPEWAPTA